MTSMTFYLTDTGEFEMCLAVNMRLDPMNRNEQRDAYFVVFKKGVPASTRYLHSDGQVRFSAIHNNKPTGWYLNYREAEAAIKLYYKLKKEQK